jgi:hypothetical protein
VRHYEAGPAGHPDLNRPYVGRPQSQKTGSGANPNNRNRHRQADDEGADNHYRELRKQIYSGSRFLYQHADFSAADFELTYRWSRKAVAPPYRPRESE